jgi:hypothetical protein
MEHVKSSRDAPRRRPARPARALPHADPLAETPSRLVQRVFTALLANRLSREHLSARRLSAFLGRSTIGLYHHFGSLDGFLIQVDGLGWQQLLGELERAASNGKRRDGSFDAEGALRAVALGYVDFANRYPCLYWLMTARPFDRAALRKAGRLRLETPLLLGFSKLLAACGSAEPETDLILAFSALHGLVNLVEGGRLNLGQEKDSRARVQHTVVRLAALLTRPAAPRAPFTAT